MSILVECVPNFSEGRRDEVIDAIVTSITGVPGTKVIDRQKDGDHNRCVITFVGTPEACAEAAFRAARTAAERIDMRAHKGAHPRMGATDVVPFVPLGEVTMEQCVELAKSVGRRIGEELRIPVYLYAEAATRPERKRLPDVRKGEYETIRDEMGKDPARDPDFGPRVMNLAAGATAVGARWPLIAYNINLRVADLERARQKVDKDGSAAALTAIQVGVEAAKRIAKKVRESSGGLPCVQAMGLEVTGRDLVQVSMNLTNFRTTSLKRVWDEVGSLSKKYGLEVVESEFVGCIPRDALGGLTPADFKAAAFQDSQVLESHLPS
ncbi:MAG: glutamate formimidoyltransferase [Planctomycetota bacterium]